VLVILLGLVPPGAARTLRLQDGGRLRQGASRSSPLIAEVPAGTSVEIVGTENGWTKVRTAGGRTGYMLLARGTRETEVPDTPPSTLPDMARREAPPPTEPPVTDLLKELEAEVAALRSRPEPATPADIEKLRVDIERLAEGQRELTRHLGEHAAPDAPTTDGVVRTWIALLGGALIGWLIGLFARRRRRPRLGERLRI
jgi:hypothetical protein